MGVRRSCDAAATNRRSRLTVSATRSSMALSVRPRRPSSSFAAGTSSRRRRSPVSMAFTSRTITLTGCEGPSREPPATSQGGERGDPPGHEHQPGEVREPRVDLREGSAGDDGRAVRSGDRIDGIGHIRGPEREGCPARARGRQALGCVLAGADDGSVSREHRPEDAPPGGIRGVGRRSRRPAKAGADVVDPRCQLLVDRLPHHPAVLVPDDSPDHREQHDQGQRIPDRQPEADRHVRSPAGNGSAIAGSTRR